MITYKQLANLSIETIHSAFTEAFADYVEPFDLSVEQLQYMIERRGCDLNLSFGAFDEDKLVGFTLNGIGDWNSKKTAYDTGTGIIKSYRKQGIASKLFSDSLPILKEYGIEQYLLEVIKSNTAAFDLYKKAGFEVTREFDYFITPQEKIKSLDENENINLVETFDPNWELFKSFWDFDPSWQNSIEAVNRKFEHFKIITAEINNSIVGYGIIEPHTGDIPQLAVSKDYRQQNIGSQIFNTLCKLSNSSVIKIINSQFDYKPIHALTSKFGIKPGIGQYEMILNL